MQHTILLNVDLDPEKKIESISLSSIKQSQSEHSLGQIIHNPVCPIPLDLMPHMTCADGQNLGTTRYAAFDTGWRIFDDDAPLDGLAYPGCTGEVWLRERLALFDVVSGD